ncbi:hypothetical protein BI294_08285 [Mycobacterium avium subsp. hominissuis]|nr:hypothetical protein [Mycobacterium avium]PBJ39181.1 hypothetical protein BI294_08285 [Mycobacterium avium subsp. hominissuis]QBC86507.1 hypothetical protein B6K05_018565 [Mycobacterium avium subsp. hominissuis]
MATMIGNAFGVGVARATRPALSAAGLPAAHAAHAAALAAARKHRAAAATDASVRVGGPPKAR